MLICRGTMRVVCLPTLSRCISASKPCSSSDFGSTGGAKGLEGSTLVAAGDRASTDDAGDRFFAELPTTGVADVKNGLRRDIKRGTVLRMVSSC